MATETITEALPSLSLRSDTGAPANDHDQEPYRYAALLPHFSNQHYSALEPFDHVDPASRALSHPDPRSFLQNASTIVQLTPNLGTEVHGVNLAGLDSDQRDQLALEVRITLHVSRLLCLPSSPPFLGC